MTPVIDVSAILITLWTLYVVKFKITRAFAIIIGLYNFLNILKLVDNYLDERDSSELKKFGTILNTAGIALIDIAMYLLSV